MLDAIAGALGCMAQPSPEIVIDFQNVPPVVDHARSSEDLALLKAKSISPHYGGEFPIVGGITEGAFEIKYAMEFTSSHRPLLSDACLWVKTATITVLYTPTVYVASNYAEGTCRRTLTEEHEMRHVVVDVETLKEYIPYLKQITEEATARWGVMGPMKKTEVETTQKRLSDEMAEMLGRATDNMEQARVIRQKSIDSAVEYRRLSEACPGEPSR